MEYQSSYIMQLETENWDLTEELIELRKELESQKEDYEESRIELESRVEELYNELENYEQEYDDMRDEFNSEKQELESQIEKLNITTGKWNEFLHRLLFDNFNIESYEYVTQLINDVFNL